MAQVDGDPLILATRGSPLALAQSKSVKAALEAAHPGLEVELRIVTTKGDRFLAGPLQDIGGKGLFTKEIEELMLAGHADLAVHSLKDMPAQLPPGLLLAAFAARENPQDVMVSAAGWDLAALPQGCTVGTASVRRTAQLLRKRPDLNIKPVRGNVGTRLRKLDEGEVDVLLLAKAGLSRLGLDVTHHVLPTEHCLPAPCQGIVAIEARADDQRTRDLLAAIDDPASARLAACERAYLAALDGSCRTPIGGLAQAQADGSLRLEAEVLSLDGQQHVATSAQSASDPAALGHETAETLLAQGGREILAGVEAESASG